MPFNSLTAPVVIPGAQTFLAQGVPVDASSATTAAQPLFVCPPGMKAVVRQVILRQASANMAGAVYNVGTAPYAGGSAPNSNIILGATVPAQGLPAESASEHAEFPTPAAYFLDGSVAPQEAVQPGATCSIIFTTHAAATCVADVLGYLVAL